MKVYIYDGKEYSSLYQLRDKNIIFPSDPPAELLNQLGIKVEERPDPQPEPVVQLPLTPEQKLAQYKAERREQIIGITVEVDGMVFDGDEYAQRRIMAVINTWPENKNTTNWVLTNNTIVPVNKAQLQRVLDLAVAKMEEIWITPYTRLAAEQSS